MFNVDRIKSLILYEGITKKNNTLHFDYDKENILTGSILTNIKFDFENKKIVLYNKKLPKSGLYVMYPYPKHKNNSINKIINAIKYGDDSINSSDIDYFLNRTSLMFYNVLKNKNIDYIITPPSGSELVMNFANKLANRLSGCRVLSGVVLKNTSGIKIDKEELSKVKNYETKNKILSLYDKVKENPNVRLHKDFKIPGYRRYFKDFYTINQDFVNKIKDKNLLVLDDYLVAGTTFDDIILNLNKFEPKNILAGAIFSSANINKPYKFDDKSKITPDYNKFDDYFTNDKLAKYFVDKTFSIIGNVNRIIEPAAGDGAITKYLPKITDSSDIIYTKSPRIRKLNFIKSFYKYEKGTLVISNPPFIIMNHFLNKASNIADYISFITPIHMINKELSGFKIKYNEDLGEQTFYVGGVNEKKVHVGMVIWERISDYNVNDEKDIDDIVRIYRNDQKEFYTTQPNELYMLRWGFNAGNIVDKHDYSDSTKFKLVFRKKSDMNKAAKLISKKNIMGDIKFTSSPSISKKDLKNYLYKIL